MDRCAARRARRAEAGLHRPDPDAAPRPPALRERGGRRPAGPQRPRAPQPGQLHHRVAGLPDDDVGGDREGPDHRAGRGARLHEGDGRLRGRPPHGADQPRAHRRRLLRPVSRPPPAPLGAARRHAPRLRLRRVDGRVDHRLRGRLGRRVGRGHPLLRAVPQPRLHRRRHLLHRRGRRHQGAPQGQAPGHGGRRAAQPGRHGHGQGHRRGGAPRARRPRTAPVAERTILSTAPLRGPGLEVLRGLGEVVLDPWIDHQPLRIHNAEQLAARAAEVGAVGAHLRGRLVQGPGPRPARWRPSAPPAATPPTSTWPAPPPRASRCCGPPGATPTPWPSWPSACCWRPPAACSPPTTTCATGEVYRDGSIPYQRFRAWQLKGQTAGIVGLGAVGRADEVAARGPRHAGDHRPTRSPPTPPTRSTTCWPSRTSCRCTPPSRPRRRA